MAEIMQLRSAGKLVGSVDAENAETHAIQHTFRSGMKSQRSVHLVVQVGEFSLAVEVDAPELIKELEEAEAWRDCDRGW